MLNIKYKKMIKNILSRYLPEGSKVFVFGSSVGSGRFADVDVGVMGVSVDEECLIKAMEELEESLIPYKIDLINFNNVDKGFKKAVFNSKILWLT